MRIKMFISLAVIAVLCSGLAHAQSPRLADRIRVNVPFDFMVGDRSLPSGEYSIRVIEDGILQIIDYDRDHSAIFLTHDTSTSQYQQETSVVFHNYQGTYFLARLWQFGDRTGWELPTSRVEKEMAKNLNVQEVALSAP